VLKAATLAACLLLLRTQGVFAQQPDKDPVAILELGGAANRSITDHASSFGPAISAEVTPIENWLELEAGVTPTFRHHVTEWDTDFLFKKPWTISDKAEFMFGVGPEWMRTRSYGITTNAIAAEVALDFMFWPTGKHHFGWYLEPAWDYSFAAGHEKSLGITGGFLIAIR
jgi:hypothetical protein